MKGNVNTTAGTDYLDNSAYNFLALWERFLHDNANIVQSEVREGMVFRDWCGRTWQSSGLDPITHLCDEQERLSASEALSPKHQCPNSLKLSGLNGKKNRFPEELYRGFQGPKLKIQTTNNYIIPFLN